MKKKHKEKWKRGCSEQEVATKWTLWKDELEVLHDAHGGLELDQEQEPWSVNNIDRAHRVAQVATVVRVARGCRTSSVKKKRLSKAGALKWGTALGHRPEKCILPQGKSPIGFAPKWPRFGLTE